MRVNCWKFFSQEWVNSVHWVQVPRGWQQAARWPLWGEARVTPCQTQQIPASSKRLTTGDSWAAHLQWWHLGKSLCKEGQTSTWQWGVRISPVSSKGRGGEGGGAPGAWAEILLQPLERIMVQQVSTLQSMEDPTLKEVDIPEGTAGADEECEEERVVERSCYGLAASPIPHPICATAGQWVKLLLPQW